MDGYIYVMSNKAFSGNIFKIGKSSRHPNLGRKRELFTTGVPDEFKVEYWAKTSDHSAAERTLHKKFADYRYSNNREFFVISLGELLHYAKQALGSMISEEEFSDDAEQAFMNIATTGLIRKYYESGEIKESTEFSSYPQDFFVTHYFKDGIVKSTMQYINGQLNGPFCKWKGDGRLAHKGYMLKGQRQGEWQWDQGRRYFDMGWPVLMWESKDSFGETVKKFQGKPEDGMENYEKRNIEAKNFKFLLDA